MGPMWGVGHEKMLMGQLLAAHRTRVRKRARTLARSMVSRASFRRRSLRSTLVSDAPATPPPPNFEPTRF